MANWELIDGERGGLDITEVMPMVEGVLVRTVVRTGDRDRLGVALTFVPCDYAKARAWIDNMKKKA